MFERIVIKILWSLYAARFTGLHPEREKQLELKEEVREFLGDEEEDE